jgi:hypothetical protein
MENPSVLMSYFYLRKRKDKGRALLEKVRDSKMWLLIDSGAFTFKIKYLWLRSDFAHEGIATGKIPQHKLDEARRAAGNPSRDEVIRELDEYVTQYAEWLKEFGEYADAYAELDLDVIVDRMIWEWREKLKEATEGTKAEIIVTPRKFGKLNEWEEVFKKGYTFAGVSGRAYKQFFHDMMPLLTQYKVRVHGWALTSYKAIAFWPFYSCDSTSWTAGCRYGITYNYRGNFKMGSMDNRRKSSRIGQQNKCKEAGVNYDDFVRDQYYAVNTYNLYEWVKYAKDMIKYNTNAYWMTHEKRMDVVQDERERWHTENSEPRHNLEPRALEKIPLLDYARFCNTCFLGGKCPHYKADTTCQIAARPEIRDAKDLQSMLLKLLEIQGERVLFGTFMEKIQGAPLDDRVTSEMQVMFQMSQQLKSLAEGEALVEVRAKGEGAISQLLQAFNNDRKAPEEPKKTAQIIDLPEDDGLDD